jgi:hypothetical protein
LFQAGRELSIFNCGGSLINENYVITGKVFKSNSKNFDSQISFFCYLAAHCVVNLPLRLVLKSVKIGEWDLKKDPECFDDEPEHCAPSPIDLKVAQWMVHPQYDQNTLYHDIAILRLEKPVKFNEFVKPICLPLEFDLIKKNYTGYSFEVAGWGKIFCNNNELNQKYIFNLFNRINRNREKK